MWVLKKFILIPPPILTHMAALKEFAKKIDSMLSFENCVIEVLLNKPLA